MSDSPKHQVFGSPRRRSQALRNDRCQTILYKAVFEHFTEIRNIAAVLLTTKSFQNSSFGANLAVNFVVDDETIPLFQSVLTPSSCFSFQLAPSLQITQSSCGSEKVNRSISKFVSEIVKRRYLSSSLRPLNLEAATNDVRSMFFGSSSGNSWPQLQDLNLKRCVPPDAVLEIIAKNAPQLRTLSLSSHTSFTECGSVREIRFPAHSMITDASLEIVAKLPCITSLDLSCCSEITDAGLKHISKLSGISSLNLHGCNKITDVGLELLSNLSSITTLDLSFCDKITDRGLEHLSNLENITSLNLAYGDNITDAGIKHIAKLSHIHSLNLSYCDKITGCGLQHIANLRNITSLNLSWCKITDADLEHLANLSSITSLNLSFCDKISDVALQHVSKCSRITSLTLSFCRGITNAGIEHIVKLSGITFLNLGGCNKITDAGLEHFSKFPGITTLNLYECRQITDIGLQHLSELSSITFLDLRKSGTFTGEAKAKLKTALPHCVIDT